MTCSWKENKDNTGNPLWQVKLVEGKLFEEPVQGSQNNTALIAALSSVVWANPFALPITRCEKENHYRISFYNPAKTLVVGDSLPWNGSNFCWAHKPNSVEIWPGMYEKAYAGLVMNASTTSCDHPLTEPDWLNKSADFIPWGTDPLAITRRLVPSTRKYDNAVSDTAAKLVFDNIKNICTSCSVTEPYEHLRTKNVRSYYAVTGLTRSEIEYSFGTGGPLRPKHAYSILGLMRDRSYTGDLESFSTDKNFIIVRDPLAKKVRTYAQAPTDFLPMGDCIYSAVHVNCDGSTGAIAVPVGEFVYSFSNYGWVQWGQ
jgi:hypothetical protein